MALTPCTLSRAHLERHLAEAVALDAAAREEMGDAYSHEAWGAEHFLAERPEKWSLSAAAMRGEGLAGFAIVSRDGDDAHLHRLAVASEARGGAGSALMAMVERLAREHGLGCLTLSVSAANEPALRFYRRLGYQPLSAEALVDYARSRGVAPSGDRVREGGRDYFILARTLEDR